MAVDIVFILAIVAGTVVPGEFFLTERFNRRRYYDHVIDYALEQMKPVNHDFLVLVDITDKIPYGFPFPITKGSIVYKGIRSFTAARHPSYGRINAKTRRRKNGDLDLLATFQFGNFSGIGNFTGRDRPVHGKPVLTHDFDFTFSASPSQVEVLFLDLLNNDKKRPGFGARTAFQFVEPPFYFYSDEVYSDGMNINLILQEKSLVAFNDLFSYLQLKIDDYLNRFHRDDPNLETILEKVMHQQSLKVEPLTFRFTDKSITYNSKNKESIAEDMNITVYGINLLKRTSRIEILSGVQDDALDLRFTVNIGNISGTVTTSNNLSDKLTTSTSGNSLGRSTVSSFNFTSPPSVVEVYFYLPRNKSHIEYASVFLVLPEFWSVTDGVQGRVGIDKIGNLHANTMYGRLLYDLLNATHNQLFS